MLETSGTTEEGPLSKAVRAARASNAEGGPHVAVHGGGHSKAGGPGLAAPIHASITETATIRAQVCPATTKAA